MPFAYFLHHLFKLRTVKVRACSSVIAEQPIQGKRWVIFNEPEQQVFLPLYGIRAGFAAVFHGKAGIGGGTVLLLRLCGSFRRRNDRVCLSFGSCHLYHLSDLRTAQDIRLPCKFIREAKTDFHTIIFVN